MKLEELEKAATEIAREMGKGLPPTIQFAIVFREGESLAIAARGTKESAIGLCKAMIAKLEGSS